MLHLDKLSQFLLVTHGKRDEFEHQMGALTCKQQLQFFLLSYMVHRKEGIICEALSPTIICLYGCNHRKTMSPIVNSLSVLFLSANFFIDP